MPSTTFASKIGSKKGGSSGVTIAFPDVCKTPAPGGPVPVPYPNTAKMGSNQEAAKKVKTENKGSATKMSVLDAAALDASVEKAAATATWENPVEIEVKGAAEEELEEEAAPTTGKKASNPTAQAVAEKVVAGS
jgi:hypothetical protein